MRHRLAGTCLPASRLLLRHLQSPRARSATTRAHLILVEAARIAITREYNRHRAVDKHKEEGPAKRDAQRPLMQGVECDESTVATDEERAQRENICHEEARGECDVRSMPNHRERELGIR